MPIAPAADESWGEAAGPSRQGRPWQASLRCGRCADGAVDAAADMAGPAGPGRARGPQALELEPDRCAQRGRSRPELGAGRGPDRRLPRRAADRLYDAA